MHFIYRYKIYEKNKYNIQQEKITLTYNKYSDFDEMEKGNPVPVFTLNKSFLKKNKDIIITRDFMHKIGCQEASLLLRNAKTIFLIDRSEIEGKSITIKQVRLFNFGYDVKIVIFD